MKKDNEIEISLLGYLLGMSILGCVRDILLGYAGRSGARAREDVFFSLLLDKDNVFVRNINEFFHIDMS